MVHPTCTRRARHPGPAAAVAGPRRGTTAAAGPLARGAAPGPRGARAASRPPGRGAAAGARAGAGAPAPAASDPGGERVLKEVDVLVLGGGPVGCEIALACAMVGKTVAVAEPRGCMLAAPTGWVSKALRQVGRDQGAPDGSRRVSWGEAERYLAKTATRAMKLTANRFRDAKILAGGGQAQFFTQPRVFPGRARFLSPTSALVVNEDALGQTTYRPVEVHFETAFIAVGSSSLRLASLPWEAGEATKVSTGTCGRRAPGRAED